MSSRTKTPIFRMALFQGPIRSKMWCLDGQTALCPGVCRLEIFRETSLEPSRVRIPDSELLQSRAYENQTSWQAGKRLASVLHCTNVAVRSVSLSGPNVQMRALGGFADYLGFAFCEAMHWCLVQQSDGPTRARTQMQEADDVHHLRALAAQAVGRRRHECIDAQPGATTHNCTHN